MLLLGKEVLQGVDSFRLAAQVEQSIAPLTQVRSQVSWNWVAFCFNFAGSIPEKLSLLANSHGSFFWGNSPVLSFGTFFS